MVRKDSFTFNDALRYNLTLGNCVVPDQELDRVYAIAKVNEFIGNLRYNNSMLGDGRVRLSCRQQQRVSLARALLEDVDVLILDEAVTLTRT